MSDSKSAKRIKLVSTVLIASAIALQISNLTAPLPHSLQPVNTLAQVAIAIHAIESVIAATSIAFYKSPLKDTGTTLPTIIKASLYTFFVGTVGLLEIVAAAKANSEQAE